MMAGILAALAVMVAFAAFLLTPSTGGFWAKRLRRVAGMDSDAPEPVDARVGQRVRGQVQRRFPAFLQSIERDAAWVALQDPSHPLAVPERVLGLMVLGAVLGLGMFSVAFADPVLSILGAPGGIFAVRVFQRSVASSVRKRFRRELPEITQVLAMEVAAGAGVLQGLERAASARTATAAWLRRALAAAQRSGRSPFEELLDSARELGLQEAVSFATQLDLIHRKGVGGPELLAEVAERAAADYIAEVSRRIDGLEPQMAAPTVIFFFVPFFVVILGLTFLALLGSGLFGG
ncbi:MAG: type II secretion system F family protein [Anaerolineae bacterium]